jgi:hypothetical protein
MGLRIGLGGDQIGFLALLSHCQATTDGFVAYVPRIRITRLALLKGFVFRHRAA